MGELARTTLIQAVADLICLSVILKLYADVSPARMVTVYFVAKLMVFSYFRFGGKQ